MGQFIEFAVVGFVAMLINGMLGMGFGIIAAALLLAQGITPPLVSAAVNAAKLPTLATLSLSHWRSGNLERRVLITVAFWGSVGGVAGALLLSTLKGHALLLMTNVYLVLVGLIILRKALWPAPPRPAHPAGLGLIGLAGGAIEGIGGSWGPIVTTGLLSLGVPPRHAIGSSMAAEVIVTFAVTGALVLTFHAGIWGHHLEWHGVGAAILGLIAGGVPASLLGGGLAARVPHRPLMLAVGLFALAVAAYRFLAV